MDFFARRFVSVTRSSVRRYATLREKAKLKVEDPRYLYEPKFENPLKYPVHKTLNIRLQSYDFVPLEKFHSYVHRTAKRFHYEVVDSYAVAAQIQKVQTFQPGSSVVQNEIDLSVYDRWVRVDKVPAISLSLFIAFLQAHLPIGTTMTIKEHEKEDEKYRYIPDQMLIEKQEELKSLDDPVIRKLLGWE